MEAVEANGHPAHVYLSRDFNLFAAIIARSRWPELILVSLGEERIMTTKRISLCIGILVFGATCFARLQVWPIRAKPAITLTQAEAIGDKAIAEKYNGFFCIGATFAMLGGTDQEWELSYTNTKGERKWVIVDGTEHAKLLEEAREL